MIYSLTIFPLLGGLLEVVEGRRVVKITGLDFHRSCVKVYFSYLCSIFSCVSKLWSQNNLYFRYFLHEFWL